MKRGINAAELARPPGGGARSCLLLDVREPDEYDAARIEDSRLIPLGTLEGRVAELADWREAPIVVHCHHGGRSAQACEILLEQGFRHVENMAGASRPGRSPSTAACRAIERTVATLEGPWPRNRYPDRSSADTSW